ncbi:MAG TPA: stage 0 sporulation family protein [Dehalococcoidia bacterium]
MDKVLGVRFQEAGKIYYFDPTGHEDLEVGEHVVVETTRGLEVARVVVAPSQAVVVEITEPLKPIVRVATPEDLERTNALKEKARQDLEVVRRKVAEHELPMKVAGAQYNLDGTRLTVHFTAEDRVDFRDLVRDLSGALNVRVELRQIGPRDQAKLVGGFDRCGRRLCCASWMTSFPSITIKMAKEQDLPLSPSKISGVCGRLLCCLAFEHEGYRQLRGQLPKQGSLVSTPSGEAKVLSVNVLKETVTLLFLGTQTAHEVTKEELQYGVLVRPLEMEQAIVAAERAREAAGTAQAPTRYTPPPGLGGAPPAPAANGAASGDDGAAGRKRRRRRRGGRKRRRTGDGEQGAPDSA